jgi:hypothetical protein
MTACATWIPVEGPYESASHRFSIVLPEKWMKLKTDDYLLLSKDGPFLQYVLVQQRHTDKAFRHTRKKLRKGMLPQEAAQVIIDEIASDRSVLSFQMIGNFPASVNGYDGFRLAFTHRNRDGVLFKTLYYGFLAEDWFYAIRYNAAQRYYFDKDIETFEKILSSFELTQKKRG